VLFGFLLSLSTGKTPLTFTLGGAWFYGFFRIGFSSTGRWSVIRASYCLVRRFSFLRGIGKLGGVNTTRGFSVKVKSGALFGLFCLWLFVVVAGLVWLGCAALRSRKLGVLLGLIA
jgi:hypothetical protein